MDTLRRWSCCVCSEDIFRWEFWSFVSFSTWKSFFFRIIYTTPEKKLCYFIFSEQTLMLIANKCLYVFLMIICVAFRERLNRRIEWRHSTLFSMKEFQDVCIYNSSMNLILRLNESTILFGVCSFITTPE